MTKSPFTALLSELSHSDIVGFCKLGLPESVNLDYKREITAPDKLAKTISSFANTSGGLILFGVDEDQQGCPKEPFEGMAFEQKLEERIWTVVTTHIYPPVFPEIHVCSPENDRTFVVVRVPQSSAAPHAIRHKTAVYLRTGNISTPELLEPAATLDQITWLQERRRRSEELKQEIAERFKDRLAMIQQMRELPQSKAKAIVSLGPKFPSGPLLALTEFSKLRQELRLHADRLCEDIPVHNGLLKAYISNGDIDTATGTDIFGFIFESTQLHSLASHDPNVIYLSLLVDAVADVTQFGRRFFEAAGHWGISELTVGVHGVAGKTLHPIGDRMIIRPKTQLDNDVTVRYEIDNATLRDDALLAAIIADIGRTVAWSFGWNTEVSEILNYLPRCDEWRRSG
jgi:hypothetical protein